MDMGQGEDSLRGEKDARERGAKATHLWGSLIEHQTRGGGTCPCEHSTNCLRGSGDELV